MITKWTSHLPEEQRDSFKNEVFGSRRVLERLEQMLKEEQKGLELAEISPQFYDTPNWDYKQAHTNGFKSALNMVYKILTLDPKENPSEFVRPERRNPPARPE